MNQSLLDAEHFCSEQGIADALFVIPFGVSAEETSELARSGICRGLILQTLPTGIDSEGSSVWMGVIDSEGGWPLPAFRATIVLIGPQLLLTSRMATTLLNAGHWSIICRSAAGYASLRLYRFLLWRSGERLRAWARTLSPDNPLRRTLYWLAGARLSKDLWKRWFKRGPEPSAVGAAGSKDDTCYHALVQAALALSKEQRINPVAGRVVLVNAGLAAGGAERQIVNTLIGLRACGKLESVMLLAEYLDHATDLDFFSSALEPGTIEIAQVRRTVALAHHGLASLPASIALIAAELPDEILEEVLNLAQEFRSRRPEIVHAWQDLTSIKVGLAAAIVGVPIIVLSSRNVTPRHFTYFRDFMHPGYRALAELDGVKFVNNSAAGADDYCAWLGLPRERFVVVRNGVRFQVSDRPDRAALAEYRRSLGIPLDSPVVGSVFRFSPEKRPMLWLAAAALVAKRYPTAHFLIMGDGPMRAEMEAFVTKHGFVDRIHLPGATSRIGCAYGTMDVFLLTSEFEGTPNVVLESQWFGTCVVATDAGGARDAIEQGVTGWLADSPEPGAIAALVQTCLESDERRDLARQRGPRFVAEKFGIERMIGETLAVYGRE